MNDSILVTLVQPEGKGAYVQARKRLREARMRWIDENEKPTPMLVKDANGDIVATPFSVGCIQMETPEEYFSKTEEEVRNRRAVPNKTLTEVQDELDPTIREYLRIEGVAVSGEAGDSVSFVNEETKSKHPPIREGETYEQWFERVRGAYIEKEETDTEARDAGAGTDHLRRPTGNDPGNGGPPHDDGGARGPSPEPDRGIPGEPVADVPLEEQHAAGSDAAAADDATGASTSGTTIPTPADDPARRG